MKSQALPSFVPPTCCLVKDFPKSGKSGWFIWATVNLCRDLGLVAERLLRLLITYDPEARRFCFA